MHPSKLQKNGFVIMQMPHGCGRSSLSVFSYSHPPCLVLLSDCHSLFLYFFNWFLPTSLPQSTACDRLLLLNAVVYIACKRLATSALHVAIQTSSNIRDCTLHSTHTEKKKIPLIYNKQNRYRFKFNQGKGQCTASTCEINRQLYAWYPVRLY